MAQSLIAHKRINLRTAKSCYLMLTSWWQPAMIHLTWSPHTLPKVVRDKISWGKEGDCCEGYWLQNNCKRHSTKCQSQCWLVFCCTQMKKQLFQSMLAHIQSWQTCKLVTQSFLPQCQGWMSQSIMFWPDNLQVCLSLVFLIQMGG